MKQKMKPNVELNRVYKQDVNILRPKNTDTESGEPELNSIGDKSQDNNELIHHNTSINAR